eukprot:365532-Chlamydomonas_euryale.AAC.8
MSNGHNPDVRMCCEREPDVRVEEHATSAWQLRAPSGAATSPSWQVARRLDLGCSPSMRAIAGKLELSCLPTMSAIAARHAVAARSPLTFAWLQCFVFGMAMDADALSGAPMHQHTFTQKADDTPH